MNVNVEVYLSVACTLADWFELTTSELLSDAPCTTSSRSTELEPVRVMGTLLAIIRLMRFPIK